METPPLDYLPQLRPHHGAGIGVIGSGGIVRGAHLPAYTKAGWPVIAIAGRNAQTVEEVGEQFAIEQRTTDYRELLENPGVRVVDIAIPGEGRGAIVRDAIAAGKQLLLQKPLANSLEEAREMVRLAEEAGVLLAVNQNARWAPVYRATQRLLHQKFLGEVFDVTHIMRNNQESQGWFREGWYAREERYLVVQYSVHYLDMMRFWLEREPLWVLAHTSRTPGQKARGEMLANIVLDFGPQCQAVLLDRNAGWHEKESEVTFRIEGTQGCIEGDAQNNTLKVWHEKWPGEVWRPELSGHWFPDAFAGPMGDLLDAIEDGKQPSVNGADNLHTLALVEAAYQSVKEKRAVSPAL